MRRKVAALSLQLESGRVTREPLRRAGELILTHQADLAPGASDLAIDGEHIELNPELTAVENAQAYFARYRKAREAAERIVRDGKETGEVIGRIRALFKRTQVQHVILDLNCLIGEVIRLLLIAERDWTGGSLGLTLKPIGADASLLAVQYADKRVFYYGALVVWLGGLWVWHRLDRSLADKRRCHDDDQYEREAHECPSIGRCG